jgi:hypothetical protein
VQEAGRDLEAQGRWHVRLATGCAGEAPSEVDSHIGPTGGDAKNLCRERLRRSPSGSGHKPLGELVDPGSNSRCSGRPSSLEWSASCAGGIRTHEGPNGPQRFSRPSRFGATASAQRVARFEVHVWELRTYAPVNLFGVHLASTNSHTAEDKRDRRRFRLFRFAGKTWPRASVLSRRLHPFLRLKIVVSPGADDCLWGAASTGSRPSPSSRRMRAHVR